MLLEDGAEPPARSMYGSCQRESQRTRKMNSGRLRPSVLAAILLLAVVTVLAVVCFRASGMGEGRVALLGMPISLSPVSNEQHAPRFQSLVGFNKQSDFPFAKMADGEVPEEEPLATNQLGMSDATSPDDLPTDAVQARPLPKLKREEMKVADGKTSQQLAPLTAEEEPKAEDSPIGLAAAASILKDSEVLDKSQGSDAWDSWKAAVKDAGPSIKDAITDDVTSYNPFPHQSLSEKMEVQDVWDRAQALAKPAGSLDGDADETKDTVENAEAQANAAAYLAANEAAATDAYDVSIPNPDMMAKGSSNSMAHQALAHKQAAPALAMHRVQSQTLAARPHAPSAMAGQARAAPATHLVPPRAHQALRSRVQALAELSQADVLGAEQRALHDVSKARASIEHSELRIAEQQGAEQEAKKLAAALEQQASVAAPEPRAPLARYVGRPVGRVAAMAAWPRNDGAREEMRVALQAAQTARERAHAVERAEEARKAEAEAAETKRLEKLLKEDSLLRQRKRLLRQQQALRQQQLQAEGEEEAAAAEGESKEGEQTAFDVSRGSVDERVHKNKNMLSDMIGMALGDERRPMSEVVEDVHGASDPPLNLKHKGVTYLNGLNGGQDPLRFLGSYDGRTAAEIYQHHRAPHEWPPHWSRGIFPKEEETEEGPGENMDGVEEGGAEE